MWRDADCAPAEVELREEVELGQHQRIAFIGAHQAYQIYSASGCGQRRVYMCSRDVGGPGQCEPATESLAALDEALSLTRAQLRGRCEALTFDTSASETIISGKSVQLVARGCGRGYASLCQASKDGPMSCEVSEGAPPAAMAVVQEAIQLQLADKITRGAGCPKEELTYSLIDAGPKQQRWRASCRAGELEVSCEHPNTLSPSSHHSVTCSVTNLLSIKEFRKQISDAASRLMPGCTFREEHLSPMPSRAAVIYPQLGWAFGAVGKCEQGRYAGVSMMCRPVKMGAALSSGLRH